MKKSSMFVLVSVLVLVLVISGCNANYSRFQNNNDIFLNFGESCKSPKESLFFDHQNDNLCDQRNAVMLAANKFSFEDVNIVIDSVTDEEKWGNTVKMVEAFNSLRNSEQLRNQTFGRITKS